MIPIPVKVFFGILPFVSLFMLPWPFTLGAALAAGLVFPPLAIAVGILADLIYLTSGAPLPTLAGIATAIVALGVRAFAKQRIMAS